MTVQPTREQLRALANAATPGPWGFDDLDGETYLKPPATGAMLVSYGAGIDQQRRDATFIAAARTAIPQLLDQLDQAEARIKAVRDVLAHHPYGGPGQEDAIRRALDG